MKKGSFRAAAAAVLILAGAVGGGEAEMPQEPECGAGAAPEKAVPDDAGGAEGDAAEGEKGWHFAYMPYVWFLSKELSIGTPDYLRHSESTFFDTLRNDWQWGAKLRFEAAQGHWTALLDAQVVRLIHHGRSRGFKVKRDVQQLIAEALAARRFGPKEHCIETLTGIRYFYLDANVDVRFIKKFNDIFEWYDPLIGLRHNYAISPRWRVESRADMSGFGMGSEFTWQVSSQLFCRIGKSRELTAGYRHLDFDYRKDAFLYQSAVHGPFIGIRHEF
jgi:hypothetical protein